MPRRPRIILPDIPLHLIQRGNNHQICFAADEDCQRYLEWLQDCSRESGCEVHAYVLMTNHVHLLVTPRTATAAGDMMKRLGQRYVQYFNRTYGRSGTLWEGRFRSCPVQDEHYLLACYRYLELNPVRAGMVAHPGEYRWSSYHCNARSGEGSILTPHPIYLGLGSDEGRRRAAYQQLFHHELDGPLVEEIRDATNGNFALGNERFRAELEAALQRRATRGRPGRPRKPLDEQDRAQHTI